jgi:hypothetical protein
MEPEEMRTNKGEKLSWQLPTATAVKQYTIGNRQQASENSGKTAPARLSTEGKSRQVN